MIGEKLVRRHYVGNAREMHAIVDASMGCIRVGGGALLIGASTHGMVDLSVSGVLKILE